MSADDTGRYGLVAAERLMRPSRQSSPDSDPNELKRRLREREEQDDEKRDARITKLEDSVAAIDKTILEFKAMVRAWLMATSALWGLIALAATLAIKFWPK